jgi:HAD superfamily hydrolase (TIGR01490 family)
VSASPPVVAAFDFDGTLTRRDTLLPFLLQVAGPLRVGRALARDAPHFATIAAGRGDRDVAKANVVARVLGGMAHDDVMTRGQAYARRIVERALRPNLLERLRWHQSEGHQVVIVSASLDAYLHDVAQQLDVTKVLCTTLEVEDGVITGRLRGGNCRGPEKAARLEAFVARNDVHLWAYGDSRGDDEMLAMAHHAMRVTRRGQLVPAVRR